MIQALSDIITLAVMDLNSYLHKRINEVMAKAMTAINEKILPVQKCGLLV